MSYTRLTRDFYQAVEALMEGKVEEKLDPQASEGGGSEPKTDKHKKLAAMGHPKDKITHKDVLIARGVVAKEEAELEEEVEELDELSKSTLGSYVKKRVKQVPKMEVAYQMAPDEGGPFGAKRIKKYQKKVNTGIGRAVDRLAKEEVEIEEGKETEQMMVKSFKPEVVKALDKRGVTKHAPYKNPGLEKLAAQKKAMKEEVEELDELSKDTLKSYVKAAKKDQSQRNKAFKSSTFMDGKAARKTLNRLGGINRAKEKMSEEIEEEVDQIITENNSFEIEIPAVPTYKDYLDAAMTFVDPEDALTVAEAFYNDQDESLIIESFTRSDIEQKVAVHRKAGNEVSMPKFGNKDGKPYAEYVVKNKEDGIRRKYIHHGTMRRVENMGAKGKKDAD